MAYCGAGTTSSTVCAGDKELSRVDVFTHAPLLVDCKSCIAARVPRCQCGIPRQEMRTSRLRVAASASVPSQTQRRGDYRRVAASYMVYYNPTSGRNVDMRIAQVAPLTEAVPPKLYGGTERVVAYLTDALVELGHEVTLFASGDSLTKAKLAPIWPRALRLDPSVKDFLAPVFMELETVAQRAHEFDVIHSHLDYFGYPLLRLLDIPSVTTLHGRLDLPALRPLYGLYGDVPVVSISNSQRAALPQG